MKVIVTGADGQVGRSLSRTVPATVQLLAFAHADLDITNSRAVLDRVSTSRPDLIINAAAYTAVDRAESDTELVYRVNSQAVEYLTDAANKIGARFMQLSTDFVFDGIKSRPYQPDDTTNPVNVYGLSKRDGELKALTLTGGNAVVLRTAWIYSEGNDNFVAAIMRAADGQEPLRVVCDQVGTPTSAMSVAEAIWRIAEMPQLRGVLHWTDAGVASRYDFAVAIMEECWQRRVIPNQINVVPIYSTDFPTAAKRPAYCVLDLRNSIRQLKLQPRHWRSCLRKMLDEKVDV
jgi:dTDP-4-dehydrorhamnose reductase